MNSKLIGTIIIITIVVLIGMLTLNSRTNTIDEVTKEQEEVLEEELVATLPMKTIETVHDYWPILKDTMWHYTLTIDDVEEKDLSVSVDFIKDNIYQLRFQWDEEALIKVYVYEEGVMYEVASIEDTFIKNDYTLIRQYKEAVLTLPTEQEESIKYSLEVVEGDTWVDETLGELKTLEVSKEKDTFSLASIYTGKLGLTHARYEVDSKVYEIQLKERKTNEPLKLMMEGYYPNLETDQMDRIEQSFSVLTNEEPKHFLTDILMIQPTEGHLASLPVDVQINTLYMEKEMETLYIDLSGEYSEYDVYERQLAIESLAKTVGEYYDAKYVILTVNGEVYEEAIRITE